MVRQNLFDDCEFYVLIPSCRQKLKKLISSKNRRRLRKKSLVLTCPPYLHILRAKDPPKTVLKFRFDEVRIHSKLKEPDVRQLLRQDLLHLPISLSPTFPIHNGRRFIKQPVHLWIRITNDIDKRNGLDIACGVITG